MDRKRLIVLGGGFAGMNLIRRLKNLPLEITLIDKKNHHLFQPLLYQVATATLAPRDISIAFRELFASSANTSVIMGEVVRIDKDKKSVILGNGDTFTYDYLAIAVGSHHSYFGHDEWAALAPGIKTLRDALKIREHILTSFEKAERLDSLSESYKYLTFVIVGAGPTGVEFAGTISELIKTTMHRNFRRIQTENARIYLVEAADRTLPSFPSDLSEVTKKTLEKMGVTVLTEHSVTNITEEGVQVGKTFIPCKNVIWAAGNKIPVLVNSLNTPQDRQGRVIVNPDLSIPDYPEIFVLGDAAHFKTKDDRILPGVATVAIQQGQFLGKLLKKEIKSKHPPKHRRAAFSYLDKGSLATIGSGKAVASIWHLKISGLFAWLIWAVVHIGYLATYRNRLSVMLEWFMHHLTGARASRIIHGTIDEKLAHRDESTGSL